MFEGMKWGCLLAAVFYILAWALSWIITCGIVALVCLIFSWEFSWLAATGIWLLICLIHSAVKK